LKQVKCLFKLTTKLEEIKGPNPTEAFID